MQKLYRIYITVLMTGVHLGFGYASGAVANAVAFKVAICLIPLIGVVILVWRRKPLGAFALLTAFFGAIAGVVNGNPAMIPIGVVALFIGLFFGLVGIGGELLKGTNTPPSP
jgi:hypothetical protein